LFRDENGVGHVTADTEAGIYYGMGCWHATDRGMQMLLTRIIGRGRASEMLIANEQTLELDKLFRRLNFTAGAEVAIASMDPRVRALCQAYCDGANSVLAEDVPWELRLLGCKPEPWTIADTLLISRMAGYVSLAQSQGDVERLLVEMVQAGVKRGLLEELFPGLLNELDEDLVRGVTLTERLIPRGVLWNTGLPTFKASNSWVIAASKTASGAPMLANDPHLEINRLPNVWYEIALDGPAGWAVGFTMPGIPALIAGRTKDLAWGVTYAFADATDSWIERCRDRKVLREGGEWKPISRRVEEIRRKNDSPITIAIDESDHGVIDGDAFVDGDYLATRWAPASSGPKSLAAMMDLLHARDVERGMERVGQMETAWNWVLADRAGNIGYQMSGLIPRRREGVRGFVPLPGWESRNDWCGFLAPEELPRCTNPACGFLVTANSDLNHLAHEKNAKPPSAFEIGAAAGTPLGGLASVSSDAAQPSNMTMASYRFDRITQLVERGSDFTVDDFRVMQYDLFSTQAQRFMEILKPLLPNTEQGRMLRDWDCSYRADSRGAYLFERVYEGLQQEVFGENGLGRGVTEALASDTGIFGDFYGNFDRVLLSEQTAWFGNESRDVIYRRVLSKALDTRIKTHGEHQQITLTHLLFQGKLPRWLGFDIGPMPLVGSRATIHQGQVFSIAGRTTSFGPSFHMVTDLAEDAIHTNVVGGPSDRRFSRWYRSEVANWQRGELKRVAPLYHGLPARAARAGSP
jgi:penicillin amidase